jgi:hypothetical protein
MPQSFDTSRSLTAFEQDSTLVAVIEMSQSKWLVAGMIPGVARQPLKKLDADPDALLKLDVRSSASSAPMRPDGMGSGWPAGCRPAPSRLTSSILRASRYRASTGVPKAIGSTRNC